jgi:AhpD family alkylhydroperoxidase
MSWLPREAGGETPLDRSFGLRPNLYAAYRDFVALFWERKLLDPVLLELCRLRVAQLLGCEPELAVRYAPAREAGLGEEKIAELERWWRSPRFDAAERACLRFAEGFVQDPHAITDEDAAAVRDAVGEPGLVALSEALAIFDGFSRFRTLLGVEPPPGGPRLVRAPAPGEPSQW